MNQPTATGRGFTLVETLVAVMLLAVGLLALGALLLRSSRLATASATTVHATASLSTEVSRLHALPFDGLATGTTCDTTATAPYPHIRCTQVTDLSATVKEVQVVVSPASTTLKPDTVKFQRSTSTGDTTLNTP
jgi:prepilin-type N-terminal cleavage/methylation domain-containing protein